MADRPSVPKTTKKKVKTGCCTCKTRRIKCDEGRPACRRCISTGRICGGYGIWGGGGGSGSGSEHAERSVTVATRPTPQTCSATVEYGGLTGQFGKMSPQQLSCFSWFRYRTYAKLPLPFTSPFWHSLILQACAVEPAILHATLALGSAHRKESFDDGRPKEPCAALDTHQEFMLREYSEAIRALQPHFSKSQDRKSAHVALATCALFTFFENLLGRYAAGRAHLHSGLRLLAEHYAPVAHPDTQLVSTKPRGYVDDWIIEIFSRLHIQAALLGQGLPGICPRLPKFPAEPTPTYFKSTNQAGNYMDRLMFDILHLAEQASTPTDATGDSSPPVDVRDGQQRLRKDLMSWLSAYNATPTDDREAFSSMDLFYIRIPRAYHTMFTIILNTISWPACEMMYDYYTEDFMSLIKQLVDIWKAHTARPAWHLNLGMPDFPPKMAHSVGDKGWLPLVHFVAVKCRVHRIRRQAIRLLGQTMHKEGIWDSTLTLAVAKEVVRIEEGDYYQALEVDDDFDVVSIPTERDIALPPLPEYRRISNVQVGLPEHSLGALTLEYDQRRKDGGGMKRKKRQYDLRVRQWSDSASAMAS